MKKYLKDYLGFIIAGLLLIYMVFIKTSGAGIDTSVFKSQIDSLQLRVDSVQLLNDSLKIFQDKNDKTMYKIVSMSTFLQKICIRLFNI